MNNLYKRYADQKGIKTFLVPGKSEDPIDLYIRSRDEIRGSIQDPGQLLPSEIYKRIENTIEKELRKIL